MIKNLLVVVERLPRLPSISADPAIVPRVLLLSNLQYEVVQFDYVCVLIVESVDILDGYAKLALTLFSNWFDVPSIQTMRFLVFGPGLWLQGRNGASAAVLEFGSAPDSVKSALRVSSSAD